MEFGAITKTSFDHVISITGSMWAQMSQTEITNKVLSKMEYFHRKIIVLRWSMIDKQGYLRSKLPD